VEEFISGCIKEHENQDATRENTQNIKQNEFQLASSKAKEIIPLWRILSPRQGPKPFTRLPDSEQWTMSEGAQSGFLPWVKPHFVPSPLRG